MLCHEPRSDQRMYPVQVFLDLLNKSVVYGNAVTVQ